jgi:hypothetical protein
MSDQEELVVRWHLKRHGQRLWQMVPFDWLDLPAEEIDDMLLLPIPESVICAYRSTRADPSIRARYAGDYDKREPDRTMQQRRWGASVQIRGKGWRVTFDRVNDGSLARKQTR